MSLIGTNCNLNLVFDEEKDISGWD